MLCGEKRKYLFINVSQKKINIFYFLSKYFQDVDHYNLPNVIEEASIIS